MKTGLHAVQLRILLIAIFPHAYQLACTSPATACDCVDSNGKILIICRDKQLRAIPSFTRTPITYDEITFGSSRATGCPNCNKIIVVPDNAFANLSVRKIVLTQNAISIYSVNAFSGLETILEGLELEGDGTNAAPYQVIRNLTYLKQLRFEHFSQGSMTRSNSPTSFPQLQQLTLKNIKKLNSIDYNAFTTNSDQPKFPILNTLRLIDIITLTILPVASIETLTQLTELEISGTGIQHIYAGSFEKLSKLINLQITYNSYLQDIDSGAFDGIYNTVEVLFLGHNKLSNLNSLRAGTWTELTQLNLRYNPLVTIPSSAFNTTGQNLAYLSLKACRLTSIDRSMFDGLKGLHTLVLSNNMIQTVSASAFQNNPGLTELRLDRQQAPITLNVDTFNGIENSLNHLYIGHNTVDTTMFWTLIEKLPNVLELNAQSLNLQAVPDKAFKNNAKITILDLDNNNINALEEGSFFRIRDSLESLTLSFNSISSISKCVFNNFTMLKDLYLHGNSLVCDCRLRWLYDWVHTRDDIFQASFFLGGCSRPPTLSGIFFHEIYNRNNLTCKAGYVEPVCIDLYAITTTVSPTTTTTTDLNLIVNILFGHITHNSVLVMWIVSDKTEITGYVLETRPSNLPNRSMSKETESETVINLEPDSRYTFCLYLEINNVFDTHYTTCKSTETIPLSIPTISLGFGERTETSITIAWTVSNKTDVSGYVLDIFTSGRAFQKNILIYKYTVSHIVYDLDPATYYTFCLYFMLHEESYPENQDCKTQKTKGLETTQRNDAMWSTTLIQTTQSTSVTVRTNVGSFAIVATVILIKI